MNKLSPRQVLLFWSLATALAYFLGWRELTLYPDTTISGMTQVCKMPFFTLGTKTKNFFGDAIDDGSAKLTFSNNADGDSNVFTLDSKGNYRWKDELGTIPRTDAQRIFDYLVRIDLLSTKFKANANASKTGAITLEANGKTSVVPDVGPNLCDVTEKALLQVSKIYSENTQRQL